MSIEQVESFTSTDDIIARLKRIDGQVQGLIRMLESNRSCSDVVTQAAATKAAFDKLSVLLILKMSQSCRDENSTLSEEDLSKYSMYLA